MKIFLPLLLITEFQWGRSGISRSAVQKISNKNVHQSVKVLIKISERDWKLVGTIFPLGEPFTAALIFVQVRLFYFMQGKRISDLPSRITGIVPHFGLPVEIHIFQERALLWGCLLVLCASNTWLLLMVLAAAPTGLCTFAFTPAICPSPNKAAISLYSWPWQN